MMTKIYDLAYEINGDTINLEQDMGCGEVSRIDLHPIHLRLLAEEAGMLPPSSNIEADRTIARLCRQMRTLYERIDHLDDWLHQHSDHDHADLSYETAYSVATWEIANEFLKDLPESAADRLTHPAAAGAQSRTASPANTPENGSVSAANTPKNGGLSTGKTPKNGGVSGLGVDPDSVQAALALEGRQ